MSRVTCWEDDEPYPNATALFQASVTNAILGRRGQALLKEVEAALEAMPDKRLVSSVVCEGGEVCLLAALAVHRAVMAGKGRAAALAELEAGAKNWGQHGGEGTDDEDETLVWLRDLLKIRQKSLAWTLVFENDESYAKSPEDRYERMLRWVRARIRRYAGWYLTPAPFEVYWAYA